MRIGVPYETFWSLSPYEFEVVFDGYIEQQKHINYMNWINGGYTLSALISVLSGMFNKNGGVEYRKEPIQIYKEKKKELTEEEKRKEQEKILLALQAMQVAYEANHPKKKKKDNEIKND